MKNQDYSAFDIPEILSFMFHPRSDHDISKPAGAEDFLVKTSGNIHIGTRFFKSDEKHPFILFFHGNGEIASDYDDIGPLYNQLGLNFMVADYRGYGKSNGFPTVTGMMSDCLAVFDFVKSFMAIRNFGGPLLIMGRSLGSACACETAYLKKDTFDGLILESGFSGVAPLLERLGAPFFLLPENNGFLDNSDKLKNFDKPVLIIHAENDHIIPLSDAEENFAALPVNGYKKFLKISLADHNSIFYYGMQEYLEAVLKISMECTQNPE